MPPRSLTASLVLVCSLTLSAAAAAVPPRPTDLPGDDRQLGDAFVEAWTALRRDLDALGDGGVHPDLLDHWLAAAPAFALRDTTRLATDPQVVLAAAAALAARREAGDHALLAALAAEHQSLPSHYLLWGARIRAGDRSAKRSALIALGDPRLSLRLEAAQALASAGQQRGLDALRQLLKEGGREAEGASRALGRFGAPADDARIAQAVARFGPSPALSAGRGELALRGRFPEHHRALIRRDPASLRESVSGGLYDTWLAAVGDAIRAGAAGSAALLEQVEAQRRGISSEGEGELQRRRLEKLIDWWREVNQALRSTADRPQWPPTFAAARDRIRDSAGDGQPSAAAFAGRVSAAIALLGWCAGPLDHERIWEAAALPTPLTPGAGRLADRSLSTTWRVVAGQQLQLELTASVAPRRLWIANTCADGAGARIAELRVSGTGTGGRFERRAELDQGRRYFQPVDLPRGSAERLTVTFTRIVGAEPACVAELRAD